MRAAALILSILTAGPALAAPFGLERDGWTLITASDDTWVFMRHHADLLDPSFWQSHKERIQAGHMFDVFPYDPERRLPHAAAPPGVGAS